MWATCCNWFCLDGQPEEVSPAPGARTQAYSNPGYSSFPSPTGLEPSCKACGAHFANTARKVSAALVCSAHSLTTAGKRVDPALNAWHLTSTSVVLGTLAHPFFKGCSRTTIQVKAKRLIIDLEPDDLNSDNSFVNY